MKTCFGSELFSRPDNGQRITGPVDCYCITCCRDVETLQLKCVLNYEASSAGIPSVVIKNLVGQANGTSIQRYHGLVYPSVVSRHCHTTGEVSIAKKWWHDELLAKLDPREYFLTWLIEWERFDPCYSNVSTHIILMQKASYWRYLHRRNSSSSWLVQGCL